MGLQFPILPVDSFLSVGRLAGRGLLVASGLFLIHHVGRKGNARAGARAEPATAHDNEQRAPRTKQPTDSKASPVFHCPLWPECVCPGGTMRPECPGLKSRIGTP